MNDVLKIKDEACFLSFENDQSLIIYDKMSPDAFKARDFSGRIGIVKEEYLEFYTGFNF